MLRLPLHVVRLWWDIIGVGDILAPRGLDTPWGIQAVGGSAVGWAVHRGAIIVPRLIHGLVDNAPISPGRGVKMRHY